MAELKRFNDLVAKLRAKAAASKKEDNASVSVGYTTAYALFVHENKEMKLEGQPRPSGLGVYWGPHGSNKFLEKPARELSNNGELGSIVFKAKRQGKTTAQGLLLAGLRLQRESQQEVPVEYGTLKQSAFTRLDG